MEENIPTNGDKFKNSLCYIPFGWIVLFFTEENKTKELMKHIKYWTFLLIAFMVSQFIIVWILGIPFWWILFLIYAWTTGYLWFKAYNWEDINIEYIDEFEKKIKDNMKDDTIAKKDEKKEEKKDDDVLNF